MISVQSVVHTLSPPIGYPPFIPLVPNPIAGGLGVLALTSYTIFQKSLVLPKKFLVKVVLTMLVLFLLQEIRLDNNLIEDLTAYTGGRIDKGITHYLSTSGRGKASVQMFHGFGASCLSWNNVIAHLESKVDSVAADLAGFGFNIRSNFTAYNKYAYTPIWNAVRSNEIIDTRNSDPHEYVIIGHSMGTLAAVASAVLRRNQSDKKITLILESPAFPLALGNVDANMSLEKAKGIIDIVAGVGTSIKQMALVENNRGVKEFLRLLILSPVLSIKWIVVGLTRIGLRRILNLDLAWKLGIRLVAFNKNKVSMPGYKGYKLPVKARGFDWQFIKFVLSQQPLHKYAYASSYLTESVRLIDALAALLQLKVDIILYHGAQDSVIPVRNSRQLKTLLPSIRYIEEDRCGHAPHEETPRAFLDILDSCL
jgi:pimeloyl-ACP methyl ester carboxylesterase